MLHFSNNGHKLNLSFNYLCGVKCQQKFVISISCLSKLLNYYLQVLIILSWEKSAAKLKEECSIVFMATVIKQS